DGARGSMDNAVMRGVLNGWQLSGISTLASGIPVILSFTGDAALNSISAAYFGTADVVGPTNTNGNGLAPVYSCDPRTGGSNVGEKMFDVNCIGVPNFGENGDLLPPYDLPTPTRMNHDLTLFKNFPIHGEQKLQFRVGFFNIFNQAFANTNIGGHINLTLETQCNVHGNAPDGTGKIVSVCDPTGGFHYNKATTDNFGKINLKR